MLPVTLRFFGSMDPVTRFDISAGLTSSALILLIYLIEVIALAVLIRRLDPGYEPAHILTLRRPG
jgi:hypothetical protein